MNLGCVTIKMLIVFQHSINLHCTTKTSSTLSCIVVLCIIFSKDSSPGHHRDLEHLGNPKAFLKKQRDTVSSKIFSCKSHKLHNVFLIPGTALHHVWCKCTFCGNCLIYPKYRNNVLGIVEQYS